MKFYSVLSAFLISLFLFSCTGNSGNQNTAGEKDKKVALDPVPPNTHSVQDIDAVKLKAMIASSTGEVLLDVRTPGEWSEGIIPGATKIDFQNPTFKDEVSKLDKSKSYVVYCAVGGRSAQAASIMTTELGFSKVNNLVGGIKSWKDGGGEVSTK